MLPDIVKPSGIRKTVQMAFGGLDLRPDAADGTFAKTQNMSSDRFPLQASRAKRRAVYTEQQIEGCRMIGFGTSLICCINGGFLYCDGVPIGTAARQVSVQMVPFGNKLILPDTREIVDLSRRPKGCVTGTAQLPAAPSAGDAYIVNQASPRIPYHLYVYEDGAWADKGPMITPLEAAVENMPVVFRDGSYQGENAVGNTISLNVNVPEMPEQFPVVPKFNEIFRVGDAVTIRGANGEFGSMDELNQTLIIRELTETEIRFYEHSFANLVGRYTVKEIGEDGEGGDIGPGLYEVTDWNRFELETGGHHYPKKYFIIPAGTTLTEGAYIEYRYQYSQFNPAVTSHCFAEIKLFDADGTEIGVTVTPISGFEPEEFPAGPTKLPFDAVDCGESLYLGALHVTISRRWPEGLQGVFANANRLWGWVDHQIRCSKLGDPGNWDFFDGVSEDSWAVDVHDPDPFTGGISVHGYPTIFTENRRYRVYGGEPASYQLTDQPCNGVKAGCAGSMAAFDGALYYVSRIGVMQDAGDLPACVSEALGLLRLSGAVGAGSLKRYFVCGTDDAGDWHNLMLDTRNGVWIDEGSRQISSYAAACGVMHAADWTGDLNDTLTIWAYGSGSPMGAGTQEGAVSSVLETNDYTMAQPNRKRVHRVQLRFVLAASASLTVAIQYDGDGTWHAVKTITGDGKKKSVYLPVIPRRCDHFRLKFSGSGDWELHSLALDVMQGSAVF